jgi:hypothetical protein
MLSGMFSVPGPQPPRSAPPSSACRGAPKGKGYPFITKPFAMAALIDIIDSTLHALPHYFLG